MQITDREIDTARDLGEALIRFLVALETGNRQRQSRVADTQRPSAPPTASKAGNVLENGESLISVSDAARRLSLSRSKVYGLMDAGRLSYVKIGRSRRVRLSDVKKLIEESVVGPS